MSSINTGHGAEADWVLLGRCLAARLLGSQGREQGSHAGLGRSARRLCSVSWSVGSASTHRAPVTRPVGHGAPVTVSRPHLLFASAPLPAPPTETPVGARRCAGRHRQFPFLRNNYAVAVATWGLLQILPGDTDMFHFQLLNENKKLEKQRPRKVTRRPRQMHTLGSHEALQAGRTMLCRQLEAEYAFGCKDSATPKVQSGQSGPSEPPTFTV